MVTAALSIAARTRHVRPFTMRPILDSRPQRSPEGPQNPPQYPLPSARSPFAHSANQRWLRGGRRLDMVDDMGQQSAGGSPTSDATAGVPQAGDVVGGKFVVERVVGIGGMGVVV